MQKPQEITPAWQAFTEPKGTGFLRVLLLVVWAVFSFGVLYHARSLSMVVAGWPLNFWLAAQGGVLLFIVLAACYAAWANRLESGAHAPAE